MSILDQSGAIGSVLGPISSLLKNPFSTDVKNNVRPHDFPGGFQITEYVNGVENTNTVIKLIGNMMPFQPFEWDGEQRLVKDYYPGNPEPSVQVMGPKEGPLTIKGRFKDKRYKDHSFYGVAYQYSLAVNEMRKRGNLVKFGMNGAAGDWFRYGFIERGKFKMNKQSWIDYEIDFFVISETMPKNNYFSAQEKNSPSAVNQNLLNAAAAFQASYSAVPTSMPRSIADMLNGLISDVAKTINSVTGFVSDVISTVESIEHSAHRALGLIKNARTHLASFHRRIDGLAHGFSSMSIQGSAKGRTTDTYRNLAFIHEAHAGGHVMSAYLAKMQAQFEALSMTLPKARYKVQKDDTLQNISIKHYGVSDHWDKIFDHNKLTSTVLTPGKILEIPKI